MGLLSLSAAAIVGVSATAVYAQSATPDQAPLAGQHRLGRGEEHSALLAEVLGISQEELQAAVTTARNAAIDQAVADGRITQEQADQMKAQEDGRGMGWGRLGKGGDHDAELAEALGITLEELQAAKAEVQNRVLDEAVAAGEITQEEADLMQARQALQEYLRDRLQTVYETAVAQAVTDGVIIQAQADQILSEEGRAFFGPRLGGGRHGRHGGPAGGRNFGLGHFPGQAPEDAPLPPDGGTPEESSDTVVPSTNLNL
jgi:polyhydroxyalkanoate synthesis regulator phasin